ncbi:MAG: DUF222 domain-containing protein [Acidimicrobiales bacterium]
MAASVWLSSAHEALSWLTDGLDDAAPVVVADRVRRLGVVAERVQAAMAALVGSVASSGQWAVEGSTSTAAWLLAETPVTAGAAKRTVATGRLLGRFAATRAAVADGSLTTAHAEVLAGAVLTKGRDRLYARDEAVLVAAAHELPVELFGRAVRRWVHLADDELDLGEPAAAFERRGLSFASLPSGNLRIAGELDASAAAVVQAAFATHDHPDPVDDAGCPPRTVAQRRADFVGDLAAFALRHRNATGHAPVATVDVVVDVDHLARHGGCHTVDHAHAPAHAQRPDPASGQGGDGADGGRLGARPAATARGVGAWSLDPTRWADATASGPVPVHLVDQVLCDCWVGRVALRGRSEVLDMGRRSRVWSDAQRRAIVARDRHCTHRGCTRGPAWCDIHHVVDWDDDSPTDVANGTLRCRWHHTWHHLHHPRRRARSPG